MADRSGYIGRAPGDSSVIIAKQTHTPTGVTTDFTMNAGYTPGYIDVYLNGSRLIGGGTDFSATDGSTVGLTTAAGNGDCVELVAYKAFNVGNVTNASSNFDVGNNLTVSNLSTLVDVNVSGTVTATSFVGSGSGLTGLASTDYIITGTAATFNNTTDFQNVSVSGVTTAAGVVKVTDTTGSSSSSTGALIVSGGLGVAQNLSVGGTITYEDVTSVDSLGIVTARTGLRVTAGGVVVTAGVATFSAPVKVDSTPTFSEGLHVTAGVTTIAGTSTFAKKATVNATLEATEGLNVTAGVTTIAGTSTFAKKATVNATLNATEGIHVSAGVVTAAGNISATGGISVSASEFKVGSAVTIGSAGVTTFHAGVNFSQGGILREKAYINSTAFNQSSVPTLEVNLDEGMVHYRSSAIDSASTVPNIMSNVGINTVMAVGDILSVTIITEADNTSYFINGITIDGQAVTEDWVNGSAPSDGGGSNTDTYAFNIMKIGSSGNYNNDYVVVANHTKTSS